MTNPPPEPGTIEPAEPDAVQPPVPGTTGPVEPETTGPVKIENTSRTTLRRFLLVAAIFLVVTVGTGLYFFIAGRDVREIRSVVDSFVTAVDTADKGRVVSLLCPEEAAGLTSDENDPPEPSPPAPAPDDPAFAREVTDVEVRNDAASAKVVRPDEEPYTLYLRKEADAWKVCAPVEERFTGAPPS